MANIENTPNVSNPNPVEVSPADLATRTDEAFRKRRAELEAMPEEGLLAMYVDPISAVEIVHGASIETAPLAAELAALPKFDGALAAAALDYALCYRHTSARAVTAGRITPAVQKLFDEASATRERFRMAVQFLVLEGIIDASKVVRPKVVIGYRGVSEDLHRHATLLREHWGTIANRTTITLEQIQRALLVSEQIVFAVSAAEQVAPVADEVASLRQRAFTMMVRSYSELRRGVTYVRWHKGDADRIAPPLFAPRRGGKADDVEASSPTATTPAPTGTTTESPSPAVASGNTIDTGSPFAS